VSLCKVNLFALVAAGLPGYLMLGALDISMTGTAERSITARDQPQAYAQRVAVPVRVVVVGKRDPKQRLAQADVQVPALR